jgi:hypothetical protein
MRLLLDERLSDALPALLNDVFPGSLHVRALVGVMHPTSGSGSWLLNMPASWVPGTRTSTA